jgi:REP element-mobilizing transposase RayT
MPQSLVKILVHVVFSTKNRADLIYPEIEPQLFGYIRGIIENQGCRMIIAGSRPDHIHILISLGRADIVELIGHIKRESSKWMKQHGVGKFYWQKGYGAFSIGQSQVATVSNYIRNQKQHHAKQTFADEFLSLCAKYGVEVDERYCWD